MNIPVCRSISLKIVDVRYGRSGQFVTPEKLPPIDRPTTQFLGEILPDRKVEHLGRAKMVSAGYGCTPDSLFFQAIHDAFAKHYPLALRPEVLMYLITSVVAETVKRHPDHYRHLFTKSAGKQTIEVRHDGLVRGDPSSLWHQVFPAFNTALREKVPTGIMDHMLPAFSTATPETDAAAMVSFMDAASPYYDYQVWTCCGIPEIRLLGTAEDWSKLMLAAEELAAVTAQHLWPYFENLLRVLKTLAAQASGAPQDDEFWTSIYKYRSGSGGSRFNGWVAAFLNYVSVDGKLVEKESHDWRLPLKSGCAPSHVSTVPFIWNYLGTDYPMTFAGGVLGLDDEDGYLTPALSYAVLEG